MFDPKDIIDVIAENLRTTQNPFGVPKFMLNRWWVGPETPWQGEALLFTGLMYQFVPYIETSTTYLERFEDTRLANFVGLAKYLPRYLSGIGLAMMTPRREKKKYNGILRNIVKILLASEVNFFYRPELDDYSGVLLYDLGDQESFVRHARKVAQKLKQAGIQKLITVDPHTTYALKVLYPKYIGETFEVRTYFEHISITANGNGRKVTLHDPCFYGRYLELSDVPARVLSRLGVEHTELRYSGPYTSCCGGPAESISPKLSKEVGERRIRDLNAANAPIVAMCPICLENLTKSGAQVQDLSALIAECLP